MQLFTKKKIEVIVEAPASRLVLEVLDRHGATGYTVLPALGGRGSTGTWDPLQVTEARQQRLIVVVVAEALVAPILADLGRLFADYHGVVFTSAVEVMRAERF